jgi:hypothetical protein
MRVRRWHKLALFALAMAAAFALGAWRGTMSDAESVHFAVNYPATGKDMGGPGAMGATGSVQVNVGNTGFLKSLAQPNVVNLSTHWLKNVSDVPRRIRVAAEGFEYPIRWDSLDVDWDEETHTVSRALEPDESITVDWFVTLPRPLPADVYTLDQGSFVVYDAETDERLTALPVRIVNSEFLAAKGGDCCAPQ